MSWLPPAVCYARQVWVALMGLLKIIQYDRPSFPACVETLAWCVTLILSQPVITSAARSGKRSNNCQHVHTTSFFKHSDLVYVPGCHLSRVTREALSPVNFTYVTEGLVDLVERGAEYASRPGGAPPLMVGADLWAQCCCSLLLPAVGQSWLQQQLKQQHRVSWLSRGSSDMQRPL
jgi:hypothetical protein